MAELVLSFLVISYAFQVAVLMFLVRFTKSVMSAFYISWIAGMILIVLLFMFSQKHETALTISYLAQALFSYMCLSFCFWAFINLNLTSIRLRLFREMLDEHPRPISLDRLTNSYSDAEVIGRRVDRLLLKGHLKKNRDRLYVARGELITVLKLIRFLRKLIIPIRFDERP